MVGKPAKKKPAISPKRPKPEGIISPIGWRWDLRKAAPRAADGSPLLVKIKMTGPGLSEGDPIELGSSDEEAQGE
jgi:hypothetical protein